MLALAQDNTLPNPSFSPEQVMKALTRAFPDRITEAAYQNGDWTVRIDDTVFYYAKGRLLPASLLNQTESFDPHPFFRYPGDLPPVVIAGSEAEARVKESARKRQQKAPRRSSIFFDTLWQARDRQQSYDNVKSLRFLGKEILVHRFLLEDLAQVEADIREVAKKDAQAQSWVNKLQSASSWSWRQIADTQSRSFHSYGAAIDLPSGHGAGKESYWLWTARTKPEWWLVKHEQRANPPPAIVTAFEQNGFLWGGKWLYFDTFHFEYRPELLILAGMTPKKLR